MAKLRIAAPSHASGALQEPLFETIPADLAQMRQDFPLLPGGQFGQG